MPTTERANITDPNLNGNIGQSPQWHRERLNAAKDQAARDEYSSSLKAQALSDDQFGSCESLSSKDSQLLERAKKFDRAKEQFRNKYGYTDELWPGEVNTDKPEGNQINDF